MVAFSKGSNWIGGDDFISPEGFIFLGDDEGEVKVGK